MLELAFNLDWIRYLAEHRAPLATALFQLFTFIGELEGYVLVVTFIYAAYDKRLAFRLAVLVLLTMSLNHVLKTLIANPRPFVAEGTYAERWAVSGAKAEELAAEYSTPSGHAMAGSCFYSYLCASVKSRYLRAGAIATIILVGLSRPYLGVHYTEDVLMGWALGVPIALLAVRFGEKVALVWNRRSLAERGLLVVGSSMVVLFATGPLYEVSPHGQPLPFVSYLGLLSGIVLAYPLEERWVGFDPRSSTALRKAVRAAISVALVISTLALLDWLFAQLASDASILGRVLRYVRYGAAGVVGMLLAPLLFVRLGLGERRPAREQRQASSSG
jgi:membrane-associated phospholipid phosphatase